MELTLQGTEQRDTIASENLGQLEPVSPRNKTEFFPFCKSTNSFYCSSQFVV